MASMAFPRTLRTVSHMPIGCTPGFLFKGMSQQENNAAIHVRSTYSVQRRRAMEARALHRALDGPWNIVHRRLDEQYLQQHLGRLVSLSYAS